MARAARFNFDFIFKTQILLWAAGFALGYAGPAEIRYGCLGGRRQRVLYG